MADAVDKTLDDVQAGYADQFGTLASDKAPKRGRPKKNAEPKADGARSRKKTPVMGTPVGGRAAKAGPGIASTVVGSVIAQVKEQPKRVKKIDPKDCPKAGPGKEGHKAKPKSTSPAALREKITHGKKVIKEKVDDIFTHLNAQVGRIHHSKAFCKK